MQRSPLFLSLLFCILLIIPACNRAREPVAEPAPAVLEEAATASFWSEAAAPYRGLTLHGIGEDSPSSYYVRDILSTRFTEETGIEIELRISSNDEIEQIIANSGKASGDNANDHQYDFAYVEQDVIYGYLAQDWLVNLSRLLDLNPDLAAPEFALDNFTDFVNAFVDPNSGDLYGIPIEAFIKVYLYRTDLFNDDGIKRTFEEQYHYPLAPAVTLEQYRDIAEFFTKYGAENELPLWGTSVQGTTTEVASFYEFFETIAPSFGIYHWGINVDTYRVTEQNGGMLDSEQAVDALTYWINLLSFAPPEADQSNWTNVAETFASGRVAQGWVYGEHVAWIATDSTRSQVAGHVGVALPPTAPGVMEDATVGAGYLGYYDGAAFGIPVGSQQQEAALLWLQYLSQESIQPEWAINSGRVVHLSTFDDEIVRKQDRLLNGYYALMRKQGSLFSGAPPFPFHVQVRDVIVPYIQSAIAGEMTPQKALAEAAAAAEKELETLGFIK